jgi:hypothetical protein
LNIDAIGQHHSLNLPRYDQKPLHFGFILGTSNLGFTYRNQIQWPQDVYNVRVGRQLGYTVGIVSNVRLNKNLDFRFIPTFTSGERKLFFDAVDPSDGNMKWIERKMESALIIFPLEIKWKTNRIDNHRWYVLGGLFGALDLSSKAKVVDNRIFKLQQSDFGIDIGVGIDIYFEYFKLSPQLRATFGKGNLRVNDNTSYSEALPSLNTQAISWIFTFE